MRVLGISGALVGYVLAVGDGCIQVEPDGGAEPFWIRRDGVLGVEANRVELICDPSEVHRYRLDAPPTE